MLKNPKHRNILFSISSFFGVFIASKQINGDLNIYISTLLVWSCLLTVLLTLVLHLRFRKQKRAEK
jgi:uncharacterized membrane protein YoaT (DUF817 family)